jgi:hypothetical protein
MRGTNPLRCDFSTDKGCYDCSAAILWLASEHLAPRCRLDLAKDTDVRALLLPRSAARGGGKLYLIWFHECDRLTNFRVLMSVIGTFQTSHDVRSLVAIGGEPDIANDG